MVDHPEGEELGERLRALGYLQDPLARFVSSGAVGRAGLLQSYAVVGLKVGVVLGFLLFLLLTTGFALVGRFVLLDLRDLLLFHLYLLLFALPLGVVVGLLLSGAFALFSLLRRSALSKVALAARKCGWTTGLLALAYLLLLWARLRERLAAGGLAADLVAAVVCALAAFFIARLATAAALFLGSRRRRWDPLEPPPGRGGRLALLALLALAATGFGSLRLLRHLEDPPARHAEAFEVRPGQRVLWIGIDGLDLGTVRELAAEGRLPALAQLLGGGRLVELDSGGPRHPLTWWADLSTGMQAERHGVRAPTHAQPRGLSGALFVDRSMVGFFELLEVVLPLLRLSREAPFSAALMREKALPEIVADGGRRAAAVNWWMSHPVDPELPGVGVSERAIWLTWQRLRAGERLAKPAEVSPESFVSSFLDAVCLPGDCTAEEGVCAPDSRARDAELNARALDESAVAVALELVGQRELSCLQVGLWGANALLDALAGDGGDALSERREVVRRMTRFYEGLDRRLARLLAACAREELLICLTASSEARRGAGGEKLREGGFAVFHGPGVLSLGAPVAALRARTVDVLPTLLATLGYPASVEMAGRPLAGLFQGLADWPLISSFGPPAVRALPGIEEDREALRMFRAVGYL